MLRIKPIHGRYQKRLNNQNQIPGIVLASLLVRGQRATPHRSFKTAANSTSLSGYNGPLKTPRAALYQKREIAGLGLGERRGGYVLRQSRHQTLQDGPGG